MPPQVSDEKLPIQAESLSVDEIANELGKDEEVKEDLLEESKEEEKKEGDEEKIEIEEEEKPEDEELDNIEDVPRKEILKAYPDLFKKFPQLERAYYREQRYAELLPTIDDAKEAVDKANAFDQYSDVVFKGDITPVLGALKTNDEKAFAKAVDNYLPALAKADQNAYYHVIGNLFRNAVKSMVTEGDRTSNDQLKAAAIILNQFMFGSSEYQAPMNFSKENPENNEQETRLRNERSQFVQERFSSSLEDLSTKTDNVIKSTISQHIDPKEMMTDYVKKTAVREALENVNDLIASDARFKTTIDKLWEKAFQSNFNNSSLDSIKRAYLSKAKTLLPSVIQKHRNDALKGLGKRMTDEKEEPQRKGPVAKGGAPASANNRGNKAPEIPKGMKTVDYLMSD